MCVFDRAAVRRCYRPCGHPRCHHLHVVVCLPRIQASQRGRSLCHFCVLHVDDHPCVDIRI